MFINQLHKQMENIWPGSKLFPKFFFETSLQGSPENFRITLLSEPSFFKNLNLTLSKNCPAKLDHLSRTLIRRKRFPAWDFG